jgi:hypothetical protein
MKTNDNKLTSSSIIPTQLVIYDKHQKLKKLTSVCSHFVLTSLSLKAVGYMLYTYVIKYEAEKLLEDIKRVNKRFASNTYSRIVNEFNIFMLNSIEINSIEDSHKCFVYGYAKYLSFPDSQNMLSELVSTSSKDFDLDFFIAIYTTAIKKTIGLGASLETLKKVVIPHEDLNYDRNEKTNLRGAHSQLFELRKAFDKKMSYQNMTFYVTENNNDSLVKFTNKLKMMITNPDMLMCNHISSQNTMNLRNFQENFMNVNQMGVKDLYNNILDTTDGLISMRLQNSISKSIYGVISIIILILVGCIVRKVRK